MASRSFVQIVIGLLVLATGSVLVPGSVSAQSAAPIAQLDFDIVGIRLVANPSVLTVPKGLATHINTTLDIPPAVGNEARDAIAKLTANAVVEAELRGPSLPTRHIKVAPGQPIPIPPLALPGDYFLDRIRLTRNGETILNGTPSSVPIKVIAEVLVTSVTSRPLSLDEIREKGIVIDSNNFQAMNFQLAFNIEGKAFKIDMPVAVVSPDRPVFQKEKEQLLRELVFANSRLAKFVELPPELDRPGLNFFIAPLPFFPVLDDGGDGGLGFGPPPITGLVVIPGNIAFLHQFFSVQVIVGNVAPDGTPLALRDITADIALPLGLDREAGTFESPGDDPLRLARVQDVGQQSTVPVTQPGPDGKYGTADDFLVISAQQSGRGEFLVEGLEEGGHTLDFSINATLDGLPSGPVALTGKAVGSVLVRNPTFSITLAHPRTIRTGERYDLYATVTNTSLSPANLVSVNLDPRAVSGAQLVSDSAVPFETIGPGDSGTAKFSLIAQRTGSVTYSSFTADDGLSGRIQLRTGIGERDIVLAPNAIVLPTSTEHLPATLIAAAQRVLGQAFSISSAPAAALPPDVLFIKRQTVVTRGLELAEAGQRIEFGESLSTAMQDLLLDWMGNARADDGFDQLLRTTEAGRAFLAEVGAVLQPLAATSMLQFQADFAAQSSGRPPHVTIAAAGVSAGALKLRLSDPLGNSVGESATGRVTSLPYGNVLAFDDGEEQLPSLIVLSKAGTSPLLVEGTALAAAAFDLGIVATLGGGDPVQLRFPQVAIAPGAMVRLPLDLSSAGPYALEIDDNADGVPDRSIEAQQSAIPERTLQVVAVRQVRRLNEEYPPDYPLDPATFGLIVGVLFNRPVDRATAEDKTHYAIANNAVGGALVQSSGRLLYLYLDKPIGNLVARTLTVKEIQDTAGRTLAPATLPIATIYADGAHVVGQVRNADGKPVPGALLRIWVPTPEGAFVLAANRTDATGSFDIDFVRKLDLPRYEFHVEAQHPTTLKIASMVGTIRGAGQTIVMNPTFLGLGTVRGRVVAADGLTPMPGMPVQLAASFAGLLATVTNAAGEYTFTNVPVGTYVVSTRIRGRGVASAQGLLATAGAEDETDLVFIERSVEELGALVGRVFFSDGRTPAAGFDVYVGKMRAAQPAADLPPAIAALDQATTDGTGSFAFDELPVGEFDVVALDRASGQMGVATTHVLPNVTNAVSIVMEAFGSIEGLVLDAQGRPKSGALVAGGLELVTTDANGFFSVDNLPAGLRTIDAGDPVTRRRGRASVQVLPGQTVPIVIKLEARATIAGRVLDAGGNPVPNVSVRIPQDEGYLFVFANNDGFYKFPDLTPGEYLVQAPGPPREALIEFMVTNGIDPRSAFTMGDIPPDLPPTLEEAAANPDTALAAYQLAVETFFGLHDPRFVGIAEPPAGGFGWNKVKLFMDSSIAQADIRYLRTGSVAGTTVDGNGLATGALVRVTGMRVSKTGYPEVKELSRISTDPVEGQFAFSGIPLFDLPTFQATGIRSGDFTLQAANPFSPVIVSHYGSLNANNPNLSGIILRFPPASETNGTISGTVVMPDGETPAPAGTAVRVSFGDLTLLTDSNGVFTSQLPIPKGAYTVTAEEPLSGLTGQITAFVPAAGHVDVRVRLLGLGKLTATVRRPDGQLVTDADVTLVSGAFRRERFEAHTDAAGTARFVNVTEGAFSIVAEERGTGLSGRASGLVIRDGEVAITITIAPAGVVTGTFVGADGRSPIANANVTITSGGVHTYTSTDNAGRFEGRAIPIGRFTVSSLDPLTGRAGRTAGRLELEGELVNVTLVQVPQGTVSGRVLLSDGHTPVAGVAVVLNGVAATTRQDGSFRFEGVSAGAAFVSARDPVSKATGSASTVIAFENESVELDLPIAVKLDPMGALRIIVRDEHGAPAGNVTLSLAAQFGEPRSGTTDVNGEYTFEFLPLATYRVIARSLSHQHNGAVTEITLDVPNAVLDVPMQLRGVGKVAVSVVRSDGATLVGGATVRLVARAAFGNELPRPIGGTFVAFADPLGVARFEGVPVGEFHVSASSGPLAGVLRGVVPSPDAEVAATVQLGPAASITGRILLPEGVIPAAQAVVTLTFLSANSPVEMVLQVLTDLTGVFEFTGIPLGPLSLSAFEPFSSGVGTVAGTLTVDGEVRQLGDIVLDNTSPRVVSVQPADRATGVAHDATITVTFSEPMNASATAFRLEDALGGLPANFLVTHDGARVPGTLAVSADRLAVRFTPDQPLVSSGVYTLIVKGGELGPADHSGLRLLDHFVSAFTAADKMPPGILSISPGVDERDVPPEAVVRVTFSEAVARNLSLTVTDDAGTVVGGRVDLAIGDSVAIFTPAAFLRPNSAYTIRLANVSDAAGNPLPAEPTQRFFTVDTLAPSVNSLEIAGGGTAIGGSSVTVRPSFNAGDVVRVEYFTPGQDLRIVTSAPFAATFILPTELASFAIHAIAVDKTGNRSEPSLLNIPVVANQPPEVQFTPRAPGAGVTQGSTVEFDIAASDDVALSQVVVSAVGAMQYSNVHHTPSGERSFNSTLSLLVPADAPSNGIVTVQAAAVDSVGNRSTPATLTLTLRDSLAPTAAFSSPVEHAVVLPGQALTATLDASDDVGVAAMTLTCTPFVAGCAAPPFEAARKASVAVPFVVPHSAAGLAITLTLIATDAAGNASAPATRTIHVVDALPPAVTSLTLVGGTIEVGRRAVVRAEAMDNVAVAELAFTVNGAVVAADIVRPTPLALVTGEFSFTPPPQSAGLTANVVVIARDAMGNSSQPATLSLLVGARSNTTPIANAGSDRRVPLGTQVQLDGGTSSDSDGDPLTFKWRLGSRPAGSAAVLDSTSLPTPSFVADRPGSYVLELVVNDGTADSAADIVVVTTENTRPVANAGPDQTAAIGTVITLDASASTDADGDTLTHRWTLESVPAGSAAVLSDSTHVRPTLTLDLPGNYTIRLVVNDGTVDSDPDVVAISTVNSPPVANAGSDQTVFVGQTVSLSGAASSDVDGNTLAFAWTFEHRPEGSVATLTGSDTSAPAFVVDRPGVYRVTLVVHDGLAGSTADVVEITTQNSPPVARAGADQSVVVSTVVTLDGSASTDVDGDQLAYAWSLTTRPEGSVAVLSDPSAVMPTFPVDRPGVYVAQLIVSDGTIASEADTITIATNNLAPTANAGPDQSIVAGNLVLIDGSGSSDADGQTLAYQWAITVRPDGSGAVLSDPTSAVPSFTADREGTYVVQLIVSDGALNSAPDTMVVSTTNTIPVADAGEDRADVVLGDRLTLDGSNSSDADGHSLVYVWSLIAKPQGSAAALDEAGAVRPAFVVDRAGDYVVQLVVNDGFADSAPDTVLIRTSADSLPIVTIQIADGSLSEVGPDTGSAVITRTGSTDIPLSVEISASGSALPGIDYQAIQTSVTIPAGQSAATVQIVPLADALAEGPETVMLTLLPAADYVVGTAVPVTVQISDEQSVTIVAFDAIAIEGTDPATFTVSRAVATASARDVTVNISGGSATLGSDYNFFNNASIVSNGANFFVVRIPAGQASVTFSMNAVADLIVEPQESVVLIAEATAATATIVDVPPPFVSIVALAPAAYETGPGRATFSVSRTGAISAALDVTIAIDGGTATTGTDYNFFGNTSIVQNLPEAFVVRLPAGAPSALFSMTPVLDGVAEPTETVILRVASGGAYAVGSPETATATIGDTAPNSLVVDFEDLADSMPITALPSPYHGILWTNWLTYAPVPASFYQPHGVNWAGAAVDGARFAFAPRVFVGAWFGRCSCAQNGPVYFELYRAGELVATSPVLPDNPTPGVTPAPVFLPTNHAGLVDEVRVRSLGGSMSQAGSFWLIDDLTFGTADLSLPAITVTTSDPSASEVGPNAGGFTVTRSGDTSLPLTVNLTLSGTATAGVDFVQFPLFVTIASGEASTSIALTPAPDAAVEGVETATLKLAPSLDYYGGLSTTATVYIVDDGNLVDLLIDFEDQPDSMPPVQTFPGNYRGMTWNGWVHYAPYPAPYLSRGANAIFSQLDGASVAFTERRFLGAWFSRAPGRAGDIYFELYLRGVRVAQSAPLADTAPQLTFLPSGYAGPVDQIVVRSLGLSTNFWVMDDLVFGSSALDRPTVSVVAADAAAVESDQNPGVFTVTRSGDTAATLVVNYALSGTATAAVDYSALGGSVTIAPGQQSATIAVAPLQDSVAEPPEVLRITLSSSELYYRALSPSATVVISDSGPEITELVDFEDLPDKIPGPPAQPFPQPYRDISFFNWQHYAPVIAPFQAEGANFIYARIDGARFTFAERVFEGAFFVRQSGFAGNVYFELYLDGLHVATSPVLPEAAPQLTFLASGYAGPVDEVRVRSLGSTIVPNGSVWLIDNLLFRQ